MWSCQRWFGLVLTIVLLDSFLCNTVPISFNKSIRSYAVQEDANSTVKTLQQDVGRYANFAPVTNPIRFKPTRVQRMNYFDKFIDTPPQMISLGGLMGIQEEIPDNALSGSEYSRGLLHHDHGGFGLHNYDDSHYDYGYEFDHHGDHHGLHGHYGHHLGHGYGHGHGLHHKHYNPALAAKTILWPLAGLAILGTAAALVSNPVLLQLGVISGRRRRDTQEITGPDFDLHRWKNDVEDEVNFKPYSIKKVYSKDIKKVGPTKGGLKNTLIKDVRQGVLSKKAYQIEQSNPGSVTVNAPKINGNFYEDRFVPVPLKVKEN